MRIIELHNSDISTVLKICGALFYYRPEEYQSVNIATLLENVDTPLKQLADTLFTFKNENKNDLQLEHDRLFSGIGDMPAPPWGSVYLDKESVVFGESMLQYRYFLQKCRLLLVTVQNEPEDHIGLMLMASGILFEEERILLGKELLEEHLMTWFCFFIKRFKKATQSSAYRQLAEMVEQILLILVDRYQITPLKHRDYFVETV